MASRPIDGPAPWARSPHSAPRHGSIPTIKATAQPVQLWGWAPTAGSAHSPQTLPEHHGGGRGPQSTPAGGSWGRQARAEPAGRGFLQPGPACCPHLPILPGCGKDAALGRAPAQSLAWPACEGSRCPEASFLFPPGPGAAGKAAGSIPGKRQHRGHHATGPSLAAGTRPQSLRVPAGPQAALPPRGSLQPGHRG